MRLKKLMLIVLLFFYFQTSFSQKYNFEVMSDLFGYNSPNYFKDKGSIVITDSSIIIITKGKGGNDEEKFLITGLGANSDYYIKNTNDNSARTSGEVVLGKNKGQVLGFVYDFKIRFSFDGINNSFTYYCKMSENQN